MTVLSIDFTLETPVDKCGASVNMEQELTLKDLTQIRISPAGLANGSFPQTKVVMAQKEEKYFIAPQ